MMKSNSCRVDILRCGIAVAVILNCMVLADEKHALAQIVPDNTLGEERSQVNPVSFDSDRIDGGARRGVNLFHSFEEFNIDEGRSAYFSNPTGVVNILSRVTGTNRSNILGTLGVLGNANLFFLNPNGIVFGPNARLDVRGSFLATTANSFTFPDGSEFGAIDPQAPTLLMVSVPVGLQYGTNRPGAIISQGNRLLVDERQSLILLGGDVQLDSSELAVRHLLGGEQTDIGEGGRIELGAVNGVGTVGLVQSNNLFSLSFPKELVRADVALTNGSLLSTLAENLGSIVINAKYLSISNSSIETGLAPNQGFAGAQAGDIEINASESVRLTDAFILNQILPGATGQGGNIRITAGAFEAINGVLTVSTFGQGSAGEITTNVTGQTSLNNSRMLSNVGNNNVIGNSGGINITTGSLLLNNNSQLQSATFGQGSAGVVSIQASGSVSLSEISTIFNTVQSGAVGDAEGIQIQADSLSLTEGAEIQASTRGTGNAGDVTVRVRGSILFDGTGSDGLASGIFSSVRSGGIGTGGNIQIEADSLSLTNGGQIQSNTQGEGDGGNTFIKARSIVFIDGVENTTGNDPEDRLSSGIFNTVGGDGVGDGGSIYITTDSFLATNGGELVVSSFGRGNAGNVTIRANGTVTFDGFGINGFFSGAYSAAADNIPGRGGSIDVSAESIFLNNGADLSASTFGQGKAGDITVNAQDTISVSGGTIISSVGRIGRGDGGNIYLQAPNILFTNDALTLASTFGNGDAGNITIRGDSILVSGSTISTEVTQTGIGQAGEIDIQTGLISLTNSAQVTSDTSGQGDAGQIFLRATQMSAEQGGQIRTSTSSSGNAGTIRLSVGDRILLTGSNTGLFASTDANSTGRGGSIQLSANQLRIRDQAVIAVNSQGFGRAGNLDIAANDVRLSEGQFTAETASSRGGAIGLQVSNVLSLNHNSQISASTRRGQGGRLRINGDRSSVHRVELTDGSTIETSATGSGEAGQLSIHANQLSLQNSNISASARSGNAGNLIIRADELAVREGAISVSSQSGRAGNLIVNAERIDLNAGELTARTQRSGANINLRELNVLLMRNGSEISAEAFEDARGGNVSIDASDGFVVGVPAQDNDIVASANRGAGGEIRVTAQQIFGFEERRDAIGTNDLDASSQFNQDGNVEVATLGVDPIQGLAELPDEPIAPQLAQGCRSRRGSSDSRFISTGRGGVSVSPYDPLSDATVLEDLQPTDVHEVTELPEPIVEAQAWLINSQHEVVLLGEVPTAEATGCYLD